MEQCRRVAEEAQLFEKAEAYIRPSAFFRRIIHIYAARKLAVILLVHFMVTVIIWSESKPGR